MQYIDEIQRLCEHALKLIGIKRLHFRPMARNKNHVNTKHGFIIGRTNLKTMLITIDIFTPKFRKPKKIASVLRTLAHEIAHHQKPPFKQFYKKRLITRRHFPSFYNKVNKNILLFKKDKILKIFFKSTK